jgi:hypothetical protein
LEYLRVDGGITLRRNTLKLGLWMWTGFTKLKLGPVEYRCEQRNNTHFHNRWRIWLAEQLSADKELRVVDFARFWLGVICLLESGENQISSPTSDPLTSKRGRLETSSQLRHIPTRIGWYNYAQSKNPSSTASQDTKSLRQALREYSNITA